MKGKEIILALLGVMFWICLAVPKTQATPPAGTIFFEAEEMTNDGTSWYPLDVSNALGRKVLYGYKNNPGQAQKTITIPSSGDYNVWIRYTDCIYSTLRGPFTLSVFQDGEKKAEKVLDESNHPERTSGYCVFVWDYVQANLTAGEAEIRVSKNTGASNVTRKLDCFVVTSNLSYKPRAHDFIEPLYVKAKMESGQSEPAAIHVFGQQTPDEEVTSTYIPHTNLTKNGIFYNPYSGLTAENYMVAGEESPWWDMTPYLGISSENSHISFYATKHYDDRLENSDYSLFFSTTPSNEGIFKTFRRSGKGAGIYTDLNLLYKEKIKSDYEYSAEARAMAENLEIHGNRARKFPLTTSLGIDIDKMSSETVTDNELTILSKLGFNGLPEYSENVLNQGFVRPFGGWILSGDKCDPQESLMHNKLDPVINNILSFGIKDKLSYFKLLEEPSGTSFDDLINKDVCKKNFVDYLKNKGLTPSDLGKSSWNEISPTKDKQNEPKLYYQTALFRNQKLVDFTKLGNNIVQESLPGAKTIGNFSDLMAYNGNPLSGGFDMFEMHRQGALTFGWTEDWINSGLTHQVGGYEAEFLKAASGGKFGFYNIVSGKKPKDIAAKSANLVGHGAKILDFSTYGPIYTYSLGISNSYDLFPAISAFNHAVGSVEDYIIDSNIPKSKIALLYPPATDIWRMETGTSGGLWEEEVNIFGKERMHLYLLLRHLGYPVDIISEDDVADGKIKDYKMLVVEGSHLSQKIVGNLVNWIQQGGWLYLGAGSGMYNENNEPLGLDSILGLERKNFNYVDVPPALDNSLFYRNNLETINFRGDNLESICAFQKLNNFPSGAEVEAVFSDGSPAFLAWPSGNGKIIYSGFFPGLAYAKTGAQSKSDADKAGARSTYNPPSYSGRYRDLFSRILKDLNYKPMVETDNYLVEANFLESEKGLLVTLSNWGENKVEDLTVKIRPRRPFQSPQAQTGNIESVQWSGNEVTLKIDVDDFDFIVIPNSQFKGDLNMDSLLNNLDFDIIKGDFLKSASSLQNLFSDIDKDSQVTIKDVGIMMSEWR